MRRDSLGLYLHIPFCRSKCHYCDFYSAVTGQQDRVERYVERLCEDLTGWSEQCRAYTVDSVYFGGGTPTALTAKQLDRILGTVFRRYLVAKDCEITAECNPTSSGSELFRAMCASGFNRLSVGLQSANEEELKLLGRTHTPDDFLRTWEAARSAGFDNMSVDVMFGIPSQTPESFRKTLQTVSKLAPDHLSAYALTVEPGTRFGRALPAPLPDEETVTGMYTEMIGTLAEFGLEQYEISNFAKAGARSRHNCKYWNAEEYLGFGPAAHSDFGGERFGNRRDLDAYLRGECVTAERERPSVAGRENEYVMLRMRLCEGLDGDAFAERFGHGADAFFEKLRPYLPGGYVRETERGMAFTTKGFLVSNAILSEVVDFGSEM